MTAEKDIQTAIYTMLYSHGFLVMRINSGRKRDMAFNRWIALGMDKSSTGGMSDIIAIQPESGRFWAVECKKPGCTESDQQRRYLDAVIANGGIGLVVDSLEEMADILEEYGL